MNKQISVAIYVRIASCTKNEAKYLLGKQLRKCNKAVREFKGKIIDTYVDYPVSGYPNSGKEFQKLLIGLKEKKFSCVVVADYTRLTRNSEQLTELLSTNYFFVSASNNWVTQNNLVMDLTKWSENPEDFNSKEVGETPTNLF